MIKAFHVTFTPKNYNISTTVFPDKRIFDGSVALIFHDRADFGGFFLGELAQTGEGGPTQHQVPTREVFLFEQFSNVARHKFYLWNIFTNHLTAV